jgi:hypothetical protein
MGPGRADLLRALVALVVFFFESQTKLEIFLAAMATQKHHELTLTQENPASKLFSIFGKGLYKTTAVTQTNSALPCDCNTKQPWWSFFCHRCFQMPSRLFSLRHPAPVSMAVGFMARRKKLILFITFLYWV